MYTKGLETSNVHFYFLLRRLFLAHESYSLKAK